MRSRKEGWAGLGWAGLLRSRESAAEAWCSQVSTFDIKMHHASSTNPCKSNSLVPIQNDDPTSWAFDPTVV